jgi:hypothetical protein
LPVTNIAALTALMTNGPGECSLDRALGNRLPRLHAPLGLVVSVVALICAGRGAETEFEQDEARGGTAGNGEA